MLKSNAENSIIQERITSVVALRAHNFLFFKKICDEIWLFLLFFVLCVACFPKIVEIMNSSISFLEISFILFSRVQIVSLYVGKLT